MTTDSGNASQLNEVKHTLHILYEWQTERCSRPSDGVNGKQIDTGCPVMEFMMYRYMLCV